MKMRLLLPALGLLVTGHLFAGPILVKEYAGNSGDANEKVDVRDAITEYNSLPPPPPPTTWPLPQLFGPGTDPSLLPGWSVFVGKTTTVSPFFDSGDDKTIEWTAPNSFSAYYIMTKWGSGTADFEHALHYVLAGETLMYNPGDSGPPNGLSHLAIWATGPSEIGRVPDSGATAVLLGLSLLSLGMFRKRFVR